MALNHFANLANLIPCQCQDFVTFRLRVRVSRRSPCGAPRHAPVRQALPNVQRREERLPYRDGC